VGLITAGADPAAGMVRSNKRPGAGAVAATAGDDRRLAAGFYNEILMTVFQHQ